MFKFVSPQYLWLLLLIPVFVYWDHWRNKRPGLLFSDLTIVDKTLRSYEWLDMVMTVVRTLILVLLVLALARPQKIVQQKPIYRSGVDIMLVLDASGSMAAEDLRGGRLTVAKKIVTDFVSRRPHDRLGLVVFGVGAVTKVPLTFDRNMLVNVLSRIKLGEAGDATAIGQALSVGLNRLRGSEAKSKIIILVTDGENNAGMISPMDAAELAKKMQVKIYSIAIGETSGTTELVKIAELTAGRFYQARTTSDLASIFATIDSLEKVKFKTDMLINTEDVFAGFVFLALLLLLAEFILRQTLVRDTSCIL